jgi:hypothetical protein
MNRKLIVLAAALALVGGLAFAQDLKVDSVLDLAQSAKANYFTFAGPIRYMAVDKDHIDATTGASVKNSTELFQAYLFDVKGKNVLPNALRGLFLYSVAPAALRVDDNLAVTKAASGVITVRYVHRGTAYELVTDASGRFTFPEGQYRRRAIGFIEGEGPQVLHRDFSPDGTAAKVNWSKVWDAGVPGGKEVVAGKPAKTGPIAADTAVPESMYYWEGSLQATFEANVLKIAGGLSAVKR